MKPPALLRPARLAAARPERRGSALDLAEALRRDDLWVDAETDRYALLGTVASSRRPVTDPELLLVELSGGDVVQALALCSGDDELLFALVPLSFGPVREGAR